MGWVGFPPYHEERRRYKKYAPKAVRRAVEDALAELRWSWYDVERGSYRVSFGWSFGSNGQSMRIEVEGTEVWARSENVWPLQWIDWGKNESNVRIFFNRLEDLFDE